MLQAAASAIAQASTPAVAQAQATAIAQAYASGKPDSIAKVAFGSARGILTSFQQFKAPCSSGLRHISELLVIVAARDGHALNLWDTS